VFATGLFALALIGFSIAMALMARQANLERRTAERETQFLNSIFQAATPDRSRGKQIMARDLLDQGAQRIDAELAGQPMLQATMLDNVGRAYSALGLFDRAEPLLHRAYDIRRQTSSEESLDAAATLDAWATVIRLQNQYDRAEPLFRRSLAIREKKLGNHNLLVAESMANLGECLYWEEHNAEAEPLLRQALAIDREQDQNAGDGARVYLSWVLERKGSYPEAAQLLREAVEIDKRTKGVDSPDYINALHNFAGSLIDSGDLDGAEAADRQVLAMRSKVMGEDHPDLYYPLNNLGYILLEKGDWAQALPFLQRAYTIVRKLPHSENTQATVLNNIGRAMQQKGDYTEAEKYFDQAIALVHKHNGQTSWREATITANLGNLQFDRGDFAAAESYELQALEMRRSLGGEDHPDVASSLIEVAEIRIFQGDPTTAEPMLRKALAIREKKFNPGNPAIIVAEVRLGEDLILEGNLSEAEPLLRKASQSAHSEPFPLSPWRVAEVDSALGSCLVAEKQTAQGEELLRNSEADLRKHPRPAFRVPVSMRGMSHSHAAQANAKAG
jgi:tetratricopeptide (TPR) repeat protein